MSGASKQQVRTFFQQQPWWACTCSLFVMCLPVHIDPRLSVSHACISCRARRLSNKMHEQEWRQQQTKLSRKCGLHSVASLVLI